MVSVPLVDIGFGEPRSREAPTRIDKLRKKDSTTSATTYTTGRPALLFPGKQRRLPNLCLNTR